LARRIRGNTDDAEIQKAVDEWLAGHPL